MEVEGGAAEVAPQVAKLRGALLTMRDGVNQDAIDVVRCGRTGPTGIAHRDV